MDEKQSVEDATLEGTPAEAAEEAASDAAETTDDAVKSPDEAIDGASESDGA